MYFYLHCLLHKDDLPCWAQLSGGDDALDSQAAWFCEVAWLNCYEIFPGVYIFSPINASVSHGILYNQSLPVTRVSFTFCTMTKSGQMSKFLKKKKRSNMLWLVKLRHHEGKLPGLQLQPAIRSGQAA